MVGYQFLKVINVRQLRDSSDKKVLTPTVQLHTEISMQQDLSSMQPLHYLHLRDFPEFKFLMTSLTTISPFRCLVISATVSMPSLYLVTIFLDSEMT